MSTQIDPIAVTRIWRRRILFAPISVGILASHRIGGASAAGALSDSPKQPVLNFRTGGFTGKMSHATQRV